MCVMLSIRWTRRRRRNLQEFFRTNLTIQLPSQPLRFIHEDGFSLFQENLIGSNQSRTLIGCRKLWLYLCHNGLINDSFIAKEYDNISLSFHALIKPK